MRTNFFTVLFAGAIGMASCNSVTKSENIVAINQLEGEWKVDSLTQGKDSSSIFPLLLSMAATDSNHNFSMHLIFKTDSIITTYADGNKDTTLFQLDTIANSIVLLEKSGPDTIWYHIVNDHAMSLQFKDSSLMHMSRK